MRETKEGRVLGDNEYKDVQFEMPVRHPSENVKKVLPYRDLCVPVLPVWQY